MFTATLSEGSTCIEFEALSYVWGHDKSDRRIRLNDSDFYVKSNLEAALRAMANELERPNQLHPKTSRLLWIDAICINQDDNTEKSIQVRSIKSIYHKAERVLIWITSPGTHGNIRRAHETTTTAIRNFRHYHRAGVDTRELLHYLDDPHDQKEFKTASQRLQNLDQSVAHIRKDSHWPTLVTFFDHPWWRRVWVRQEIAMSRRASVLCGESSVDWEDVATIAHWLCVFTTDLDDKTRYWGGTHHSGAYSGEDLQFFRKTLQNGGSLDFQTMLIHARSCEATIPLDRVFAILGMVQNHIDMPIDYNMSAAEVAIAAFQRLALLNDGLDALIFSQNPTRKEGIPSWAPNIYSEFSAQPSRLKGRDESLYRASMNSSQVNYSFSANNSTLSIHVGIFDSIKSISETFQPHMHGIDLDEAMRTLRPEAFRWMGTASDSDKYEQLLRTLTRDQNIQGQRLMSGAGDCPNWGRFFRFEHEDVGAATEFQYLSKALRPFQTPADDAEIKAWLRLFSESIGNRRLVMTKGGKLGLVPDEAKVKDVICILASVDVPLLLRKVDVDTYLLIGEAFIHGVMDGEVLDGEITVGTQHIDLI
ncbi:MAG: hypothetical protein LQ337_005067 [Flavoplaca oasis]|nr:MAG: hypothetical protein LQ337_005067 [Flavoplaca oasis]